MFRHILSRTQDTVPSTNPQEAWKHLSEKQSSSVLIDVRESWEYNSEHAKGAKNIPLSQLEQRINEVPHDREVFLICQSGNRSMRAAKLLQQYNIPQAINVTGGSAAWRIHGLPVEQGTERG